MPYTATQVVAYLQKQMSLCLGFEYQNVLGEMIEVIEDNADDYAEMDATVCSELWDACVDACRERAYADTKSPSFQIV